MGDLINNFYVEVLALEKTFPSTVCLQSRMPIKWCLFSN